VRGPVGDRADDRQGEHVEDDGQGQEPQAPDDVAEEVAQAGGLDSGPGPYDLLLASLGACTSMTLRLYAENKKLPLQRVSVRLTHNKIHAEDCLNCETKEGMIDRIDRNITLEGALSADERKRLLEIADKCPVHRTLESEIEIRTVEQPA